jgi:hypothetical protein
VLKRSLLRPITRLQRFSTPPATRLLRGWSDITHSLTHSLGNPVTVGDHVFTLNDSLRHSVTLSLCHLLTASLPHCLTASLLHSPSQYSVTFTHSLTFTHSQFLNSHRPLLLTHSLTILLLTFSHLAKDPK